ncbi:MAG: hypothetical protein GY804_01580 [Alphaproteobacteria bacterium]|nr:hypothetical protein [Alphaproteobacteria bacterium]
MLRKYIFQHGRSMIEMLGVLAIMGVLSIGAMAGYTTAMTNNKVNDASSEIRKIIFAVKDLYSDKNNYGGLTRDVLIKSGIIESTGKNTLVEDVDATFTVYDSFSVMRLDYGLTNKRICERFLMSGWVQELGNNIRAIGVHHKSTGSYEISWKGTTAYKFPITLTIATTVCDDIDYIQIYAK